MSNVVEWLKGKKTYLLALVAVMTGVVHYLLGDMTMAEAANYVWAGGLAAAFRAAIAKVESSTNGSTPPAP